MKVQDKSEPYQPGSYIDNEEAREEKKKISEDRLDVQYVLTEKEEERDREWLRI